MNEWTPENVPNNFYRVSVKALILNATRDKFLIQQQDDDTYEVPGGGLDFGANPREDLSREIMEEMGLEILKMEEKPCYFTSGTRSQYGYWCVGIVFETELASFDFAPTQECKAIKFIGKEDEAWLNTVNKNDSVTALFNLFDPNNH